MADNIIHEDPAFPAMTLDILNNVLSRAHNPGRLAKYLTEEIREITGARCVLLIQCLETTHRIIDINPKRQLKWAESHQARALYDMVHRRTDVELWRVKTNPEIAPLMPGSGFEISIIIPLRTGATHVGAMLLLGLPDEHHIETVVELLQTLSKVLSLVFRNAMLYENQEKAIEERTKELKFFSVTMENMLDPVFWINPDSTLQKMNSSARKLLGYSSQEPCDLSISDIIPELSMENWRLHWEKLRKDLGISFETTLLTRSKNKIQIDLSANYFELDGRAYNCIIARDLTEKIRFETRLRQAQKMEAIGTLAGGIAHDFNNILSPIIGFTEILKEDFSQNSPEQDQLDEILQAALRARDLVQQILTFSRQDEKKLKPIKIQPIVKEALKLIRSSIPMNIDIQTNIDPDCGFVVADPTQIHQIIMNLATNSYHAMQDSTGVLSVTLRQIRVESRPIGLTALNSGDYALIKVIDTGTGIKKEIIDKIFDPYFSTKEKGKGTGLGLSVVQGIVKNFKGDLHVYSEPGKGTEIHIYLPVKKEILIQAREEISCSYQTGRENILLVDDEKAVLRLLQQMLERLGYNITPVNDSVEAFNIFKANPEQFDLVISDMTMPNMTGDLLTSKVRSIRPDIPVIICTGFSERIDKGQVEKIGMTGFLQKPVIKQDLALMVRNILDDPKNTARISNPAP